MQRIATLLVSLLATLGILSADHHESAPPNTLTDAEKEAGWILLFDGSDAAAHWRNYQQDGLSEGWVVENGELIRREKGAGDIITKEQYAAFDFRMDFKISQHGNSGLMFHVTEEEKRPWQTGPEIQIQDHIGGKDPQKAGWLYQLYEAPEGVDAFKGHDQWNTLRILITPEGCEQWLNGVKYCEYVKGSEEWNARVAASKFTKFPNFGKPIKGHLCLQDHQDLVSFRNLKIRVLD